MHICITWTQFVNTLRPRQNGCHFADDIFKCIFLNENVSIPIKISMKFVPKGPIKNNPALVQIMAWRRPGDKPLSEPVMVSLLTHICVTRPQWVNVEWYNKLQYKQFSLKNWPTFVVHDLDISYNLSFIHASHVNLNTDMSSLPMPLPGRLKIECAERAALKPNFLNEWINEKNILGFKLCAEAKIFFLTPWPLLLIAVISSTELILGLCQSNERWCYFVTQQLIELFAYLSHCIYKKMRYYIDVSTPSITMPISVPLTEHFTYMHSYFTRNMGWMILLSECDIGWLLNK